MAHLISFKTNRFDLTRETPNESNAFAGESVLSWLRQELANHQYESTMPDMEDWGWYIDVKGGGNSYMVGASAEVEYKDEADSAPSYDVSPTAMLDWTLQIQKNRSFVEKLLGKNSMAADDALSSLIERVIRADSRLLEVSVERDAA